MCNGANSTPDLRDRFVVGAGTTYAVGATGGANTVTLDATMIPAHTHSLTASGTTSSTNTDHTHTFSGTTSAMSANATHTHSITDPGHSHAPLQGSFVQQGGTGQSGGFTGDGKTLAATTASATTGISLASTNTDHTHTYSGTTSAVSANAAHTHTVTVTGTSGSVGGGLAHENRPPYYALAWIMKT